MSEMIRQSIYQALADICLIDPHTHINPHTPASSTLADLLGYHYYTELAHSAGMQREAIEEHGLSPREKVGRLVAGLGPLENTAQYSWLIAICRRFFDFDGDRLDASNWEAVYDAAEQKMQSAEWPDMVLQQSNVEAVFLTNDFDDALEGFDTDRYIPCLRTDDLVFHLGRPEVRDRLTACSGIEVTDLTTLRSALEQRFEHFVAAGARACAISLPPGFTPTPVADGRAATALDEVLRQGVRAQDANRDALSRRVFWTLAELCDQYGLPFDLMIGVNRGVYAGGVFQGQDLYDSRVSLIQYRELFNAFPNVKFPISVLASVTNQELVSYAWIFPNVITNGHWWYSNTPTFIQRDAAARLEAVPQTKQIGYYSDAYKLEFVWPKFDMYRQILAKVLTESFVVDRGWSEERAIQLGHQVLRGNVESIFPRLSGPTPDAISPVDEDAVSVDEPFASEALGSVAGAVVAPALGEIAGVFVEQSAPIIQDEQESFEEEPTPFDDDQSTLFDHSLEAADEEGDANLWEQQADSSEVVTPAMDDEPNTDDEDDGEDELLDRKTVDMDEFPTVVEGEDEVALKTTAAPLFDVDLEASDEQEDAQIWDDTDVSLAAASSESEIAESVDESVEEELPLELDFPHENQSVDESDDEDFDIDPSMMETVKDFGGSPAGQRDSGKGAADAEAFDPMSTIHEEFPISSPVTGSEDAAAAESAETAPAGSEPPAEEAAVVEANADESTADSDLFETMTEEAEDAVGAASEAIADAQDWLSSSATEASDTEASDTEEPAIVFDVDQEEADEEDDALLWADDEDDGPDADLILETPAEEPPPTPLPSLEEYQPLNDSDPSLLDLPPASEGAASSEGTASSQSFDEDFSSFEIPPDDSEFDGLEDDKPQD